MSNTWILFAGAIALAGVFFLAWRVAGAIAALLLLPLFAWFASRFLVELLWKAPQAAAQLQYAEWSGRYYYFGDRHLRTLEIDGELLFHEDDLLGFLEQPGSVVVGLFSAAERRSIPDKGFFLTQAGCERLLLKCPHRDAKRLLLWMRREVYPAFEKMKALHEPSA